MPSTQSIKKRMRSISSTQKITKAMKLVSLSKLQRYKDKQGHFGDYFEAVNHARTRFINFKENEVGQDRIFLIIMPDLGLCSAYTQGLIRKLMATITENDEVFVAGTQSYESLLKRGVSIINKPCSSEHIRFEEVFTALEPYIHSHEIVAIVPQYVNAMTLEFQLETLQTQAEAARDDVLYEPNYETVVQMMIQQSLLSLIRHTLLTSKVSEHTTRRIAMEKATDNAQEMIDDLGRKYNKIRQEAITQEISEIVSGMEE